MLIENFLCISNKFKINMTLHHLFTFFLRLHQMVLDDKIFLPKNHPNLQSFQAIIFKFVFHSFLQSMDNNISQEQNHYSIVCIYLRHENRQKK